jgi:hypothetical protein
VTGSVKATQLDVDLGAHGKLSGTLEGKQMAASVKTAQGEKRYLGVVSTPPSRR